MIYRTTEYRYQIQVTTYGFLLLHWHDNLTARNDRQVLKEHHAQYRLVQSQQRMNQVVWHIAVSRVKHRCKKTFLRLYSCHVFNVFNVFLFCQRFLFLKTFIENSMKNFEKHFWNHINELIDVDFIMKVAGCRAALYTLQSLLYAVPIATRLLWRYAVGGVSTWCCELRQIEKKFSMSLVTAILHLQH